jgi:AraC-like DNA-binding protein
MALAPLVACFHYQENDLPAAVERILPNGQAHLMINLAEDEFRVYTGPNGEAAHRLRGAVLAGPRGNTVCIDTAEQRWLMAVEFKPGGAAPFLPMPMNEVCDEVVELGQIWSREGDVLRERLCEAATPARKFAVLEALLLKHLALRRDPAIATAMVLLDCGFSLADVRSRVNLLPKTFVRRFREYAGLPPKRFSRVRRLQRIVRSVAGAEDVEWCQVAAEHGYTDQAHLIHDFHDLTGITPAAYRPSSPTRRNHVTLVAQPT